MIIMKPQIFLFILIYCTCFSQTALQKDRAYKHFESRCRSITLKGIPKPQWVDKETYMRSATFYPVYIIDYNFKTKTQEWHIDSNKFLVIYNDNLTYFIDSGISDFNKSFSKFNVENKFATHLLELNNISNIIKVGYLTEEYYPTNGAFPNLLISEDTQFTDKEHKHLSIKDVIQTHYPSVEIYQKKKENDIIRKKLQPQEIIKGIRAYFHLFEYYCPKDTALVFNKFIEHFDIGTGGLSKKQKEIIREKLYSSFNAQTEKQESTLKNNSGDFSIYNMDFSEFMNNLLKHQQRLNYQQYIDIHFPKYAHEQYGRYSYGEFILIDSKIVKGLYADKKIELLPYFKEFIKQQLIDCGCNIENKGFQIKI